MNRRPRAWWLLAVLVLILGCFVLPFTVFREVDAWYGSFLFWSIATVAVIGINVILSSKWKD